MAGRKDYSYQVGVDTDSGIKSLNALKRATSASLKSAENDFQAGKDEAKAFAAAMREMADRAEIDLRSTERAVESLGNALGPEMRAKLGDDAIARVVADMRKAGVTFEQMEADAEDLADGLRRLDQAADAAATSGLNKIGTAAKTAETGIARVAGEADKSGSVMANTVGNASQELAASFGIADVAGGTLGVTLGQLGEYAAEGGISLGELAKQAGPMIAVTGIVAGISKVMADQKREQQEFRKAVSGTREELAALGATAPAVLFLARAFDALTDPASASNEELKELGEKARGAGLSASALATAIALGDEAFKRWIISQADAVGIGEQFRSMMDGNASTQADMTDATQEQIDAYGRLSGIWEQGDDVIRANQEAMADNARAVRDLLGDTKALDSFLQSMSPAPIEELIPPAILREIADELERGGTGAQALGVHAAELEPILGPLGSSAIPTVIEAARNLGDSAADAAATEDRLRTATDRLRTATELLDAKWQALKGTLDAEEAFLALEDTFDGVRQAAVDAYTAADEGAADAGAKAQDAAQSLVGLKQSVLDYGKSVLGLPPEKMTKILADLDAGKVDEVERLLATLARNRDANIRIVARGGAGYSPTPGKPFATGGTYGPGESHRIAEVGRSELLNENGQTYLITGANGQVTPLPSASATPALGGGVTINVNGFVGSEYELGQKLTEVLERWQRGGGS